MKKGFQLLLLFILPTLSFTQSNYIIDVQTSPTVKEKNELFKFILELNTNQFDSVVIATAPLTPLIKLNGISVSQFTLYDNGQHGDVVASDGIYTRGGFSYSSPSNNPIVSQIMYRFADLHYFTNGSFNSENIDLVTTIAYYDAAQISPSTLTVINDTLQHSEYTINVKRPARWNEDPFPPDSYWHDTRLFKDYFCDDFFFLIQNTTNNMPLGTGSGATFGPSSNFTQGIGKQIYDLGYPFIGKVTVHWTRDVATYAVHEFLHKWAAIQDLYGSTAQGQGITSYGHWAWVQMNTSGLKGPTSFEFLDYNIITGDTLEVFRNYNNGGKPYWSNLELYMAGLVPIDSVSFPITYLTDVNLISSITANPVIMTADINTVTKDQWLTTVGPRIPAAGPEEYSIVQVVFSDELLSPEQMSYFDEGARRAASTQVGTTNFNIYEATGGRLEINPSINTISTTQIEEEICEGETFEGYTTTGVYEDVFTASNGCDSVRTLVLTVLPNTDPDCLGTSTAGVRNVESIKIYPNPCDGIFSVFADKKQIDFIIIRHLTGKLVLQKPIRSNAPQTVDVSGLKDGIYLIQIMVDGKMHTKKIIVH